MNKVIRKRVVEEWIEDVDENPAEFDEDEVVIEERYVHQDPRFPPAPQQQRNRNK